MHFILLSLYFRVQINQNHKKMKDQNKNVLIQGFRLISHTFRFDSMANIRMRKSCAFWPSCFSSEGLTEIRIHTLTIMAFHALAKWFHSVSFQVWHHVLGIMVKCWSYLYWLITQYFGFFWWKTGGQCNSRNKATSCLPNSFSYSSP